MRFGDGEKLAVDAVVVSVGRRPRTEGLLAEGTGVVIDERGFVVADEYMRTGRPGVWAVGDVVAETPQLAHVAFAEAIVVDQVDPGRAGGPGRLRPGAVGDLLPSRGGLRRPDRGGRPGRPATTSWSRRTRSAATAGPGSSGTPRGW